MRTKFLLLLIVMGVQASADILPQSFSTTINGKNVTATMAYSNDYASVYEIREPFTEHDTNFIWRIFYLWEHDTCVISYYISPCRNKDHLNHARKISAKNGYSEEKVSYAISDLLQSWQPIYKHNDLRNMPRLWYPIVKYRGQYYFSTDNPWVHEFTDSTIIYYGIEVWFNVYDKFTRGSDGSYSYEIFDDYYHRGIYRVQLQPVSRVKGLYVETTFNPDGSKSQCLVAPEPNLKFFDIIDSKNFCEMMELDYDTVDYRVLLEK